MNIGIRTAASGYVRTITRSFSELHNYTFPASAKKVGSVRETFTAEQIRSEPPLFSADLPFALSAGGPITIRVLKEMQKIPHVLKALTAGLPGHQLIIDSRIHNLHPGDFPAIPGWHTDFVERTPETGMQPDYRRITPSVKTYVINLSSRTGGVSNTEFVRESVQLNIPTENVYQSLDEQITDLKPKVIKASDGEIFEMDQLSLHRATATHAPGMRYFLRLGVLHNLSTTILQTAPQNEIRNHMQLYREMNRDLGNKEKSETLFSGSYFKNSFGLKSEYSIKAIKEEPMLINASLAFAALNAGLITKEFLTHIRAHPLIQDVMQKGNSGSIVINTRVHMLMKGQYPDLSAWRTGAPFESILHPQHNNKLKAHHFLAFVSNKPEGVCRIEIRTGPHTTSVIQDGQIIHFSDGVGNRSLSAHDSGWRIAMLVSVYGERPQNKIERQVPVYLDNINLGW